MNVSPGSSAPVRQRVEQPVSTVLESEAAGERIRHSHQLTGTVICKRYCVAKRISDRFQAAVLIERPDLTGDQGLRPPRPVRLQLFVNPLR